MRKTVHLTFAAFRLAAFDISAGTLCVSLESTNPVVPYATWSTAATNIQNAVDAAVAGDEVVVTNGVFDTGGRMLDGGGTNRIAVDKPLILRSVNGPQYSVIDGGGTNRCVWLGDGASLSGFTLTNGHGYYVEGGGGAACASTNAFLTNCTIVGNRANSGGGVYGGTLYNCRLTGNRAEAVRVPVGLSPGVGGGAYDSTLYNCILASNSAAGFSLQFLRGGGGVYGGTLYNCTLIGNSAEVFGGGSRGSTLYGCNLIGNSASTGGGVSAGRLYNCNLIGNSATYGGGGADGGTLNNCTVSGNSADTGGGVYYGKLNNCIVHLNTATKGDNYIQDQYTPLLYCCTTPVPTNGVGNIDADPKFVNAAGGDFRLRPDSPCIDAGTNLSNNITTDITGEFRPWDGNRDGVAAFDMGAYEFRPSTMTLYVSLQSTNPTPPYIGWATAATNIQDAVNAARDGDTVLVTNGVYSNGGQVIGTNALRNRVAVEKPISVKSVNGAQVTVIEGYQVPGSTNGVGAIRCAYLVDGARLSGFTLTNGATMSEWDMPSFYDSAGGGVYGGSLDNCTLTRNSAYSNGGGAFGSVLHDCRLIGNWTMEGQGGAAFRSHLHGCVVSGNTAGYGGGGVMNSILNHCMVTGNSANWGGGAANSTLYNCTVAGNSADWAGGVAQDFGPLSLSINCIIYYNTSSNSSLQVGDNFDVHCRLEHCCTFPIPTNGVGNIVGPPLFSDLVTGDFRLALQSPCIDGGMNLVGFVLSEIASDGGEAIIAAYNDAPTDILGNTRFIDGNADGNVAWDIGAYEFNSFKPPRFAKAPERTPEGWKVNLTGEPNKWTKVQRSNNLNDWADIWSGLMSPEGSSTFTDTATNQVMFYRAVEP